MRAEQFINQVRISSDNVGGAIKDDEIIFYLNNAQERMQSLIMQDHPENDNLAMSAYIQMQNGQDTYSLDDLRDSNMQPIPERFFTGNCLSMVEISQNYGVNPPEGSWLPLPRISPKERTVGFGYFLRDRNITVAPLPVSPNIILRVTGTKKLFGLDKRRGKILTITPAVGNTQLALTGIPTDTTFALTDTITIVDKNGEIVTYTDGSGNITHYNGIEINSFSSPNLLLNIDALPGVTTAHYVLYGDYSTSHSQLDVICNKYMTEYANMRIFMRDSSRDLTEQRALLAAIEQELKDTFAMAGNDANLIPINSTDYLYY